MSRYNAAPNFATNDAGSDTFNSNVAFFLPARDQSRS